MHPVTTKILFLWLVLYPVPPLPLAPLFGYLTAIALGPPYIDGYDGSGWPQIGEVTPRFVVVTVGLPWLVGAALIALVGVALRRRA
jgi:hypothetical protein